MFRAAEIAVHEEDGVVVAGVAAPEGSGGGGPDYIVFQRMEGDEDGLHFEYRDQRYGDYDLVAACRLHRNRIEIHLSRPIDELEGVDGFDVDLDVDDEAYHHFQDGLARVLDGTKAKLTIE